MASDEASKAAWSPEARAKRKATWAKKRGKRKVVGQGTVLSLDSIPNIRPAKRTYSKQRNEVNYDALAKLIVALVKQL